MVRKGLLYGLSWTVLLWLAVVGGSAKPMPRPRAGQIPKAALSLAGRWDITVRASWGEAYSWLEIEPSGASLVGRFVGMFGSARPVSKIEFSQGTLRFTMPRQYEEKEFQFEGKMEGDRLTGTVTGYDTSPSTWTAKRTPELKRDHRPVWGKPISVFNGQNLDGWKTVGGENQWRVQDGILVNTKGGANLVTTDKFEDFKLHVEFRYPTGSNSGIYLRGRYEVQIEDDEGQELTRHSIAGIYGFFAPCVKMAKKPGEWQTFDITLTGRMVTVVFNGETVIDRQTIPGITGGALDCDEGSPGPLMIQGDHGRVEFRKITLTPGK